MSVGAGERHKNVEVHVCVSLLEDAAGAEP